MLPLADEPLCVQCANHRKTCCQLYEIYVSPGDKKRITTHTGRTDFFEFVVAEGDYADQDEDPPWRDTVFRPDGSRRVLVREENGDCTFLGKAGCTLPVETRPMICRIYPYDYDYRGLRPELCTGCPTELLKPKETLLTALDMKKEDALRWHAQLYAELPMEHDDEDRADLRSTK